MSILAPIIILGLVVIVHELGHFLVAKANGIAVLEFAVGFGKKLWSKTYGETNYSLRAVPLGGFVRMAGDDPGEVVLPSEEDGSTEANQEKEGAEAAAIPDHHRWMTEIPQERWFMSKSLPAKVAVVLAGPLANLVFALVVSIGMFMFYGTARPVDDPIIGDLIPGFPAMKAGVKNGDRILSVNGKPVTTWKEMATDISESQGSEIQLTVERELTAESQNEADKLAADGTDKQILTLTLQAKEEDPEIPFIEGREKSNRYMIGIRPLDEPVPVTAKEAVLLGSLHVSNLVIMTWRSIQGLLTGHISVNKIGSPIMIVQEASRSAQRGSQSMILFLVFLSVSLGILNLLPIPILDGGTPLIASTK